MALPEAINQDTLASCVLIGIFILVGFIGNCLMLRALLTYKQLRIEVYVIFGGLALADLIHLPFAGSAKIMYTIQAIEHITDAWCKISRFISNATGYAASYHIVLLSALRFSVLVNRGQSYHPTAKHALISSIVLWVVSLLASAPAFFMHEQNPYTLNCDYSLSTNINTAIWVEAAFTFFLPLLLIVLLYGLTYNVKRRYCEGSYTGYARRMSRLITAIVIMFIVCQFPYQIVYLHLYYMYTTDQPPDQYEQSYLATLETISDYMYCILLAGKCLRPVLYAKLTTDLSEAFDEVVNCTYCSKYYDNSSPPGTKRRKKRTRSSGSTSQQPLTEPETEAATREQIQMNNETVCEVG